MLLFNIIDYVKFGFVFYLCPPGVKFTKETGKGKLIKKQ